MNLDAINKATSGKTRTTGVSAFMELELTKVFANPDQPRKLFQNIEELAQSIQSRGLLQPITVVKKDDGYMITNGERRYRACKFAKLKSIKAHVLQADDFEVQELALIENIQREDLSDFEKAKSIGRLWASGKYAQKQDLAVAIGKSPSYISKAFSSLKLDSSILNEIEENKNDIPLSVLEEISRVKDKAIQREVYEKYIAGEITRDDIKSFKADNIKKDTKKTSKNKKYTHPVVEYKTIINIDEIMAELKKAISAGAELDGNRIVGGGMDGTYLDNSYEVALFELLKGFKEEIKELKDWDESKVTEVPQMKVSPGKKEKISTGVWEPVTEEKKQVIVCYGFGTQNKLGSFIALIKGDVTGTIEIETGGEIIKHSSNSNYKITIEEI